MSTTATFCNIHVVTSNKRKTTSREKPKAVRSLDSITPREIKAFKERSPRRKTQLVAAPPDPTKPNALDMIDDLIERILNPQKPVDKYWFGFVNRPWWVERIPREEWDTHSFGYKGYDEPLLMDDGNPFVFSDADTAEKVKTFAHIGFMSVEGPVQTPDGKSYFLTKALEIGQWNTAEGIRELSKYARKLLAK